ncbi:peptidylprolyl isomerase [Erythrobacter sp. YT30]|nr:peptidylprolyl isomerase [Erythrobacter sp. YT30]
MFSVSLNVFSKKISSRLVAGCMAAGLAAAAVSPAPLSAQTAGTPSIDNPLGIPENITIYGAENPNQRSATAVVNGYVITGTDIEQRVALVTSAAQNEVSEQELQRLRFQVLRNLIDETLKIQAAEALEMKVERSEIDQTYNQLAAQNFGSEPEKMGEYLESIGSSSNALKRQIEGEIAWENLLRRNVTPFINVSQEEVEEYLARLEESRGTDEYHLGEIYMNATRENREAVLQNMTRIMEQLQAGGSFVAYARQFSEASTAAVGGDLGWVRLGLLPAALSNAAQRMQPGQLNGPIEIPGGYSIIYLRNKRQVLMANPDDAVLSLKQISIGFEPNITQEQAEAKINQFGAFVQGLRGCADADTARNEIGATVVTNDQIRAGNLPEQLRAIILGLQVGQTTPAFGSPQEGVRVLMLCGRDDPQNDSGPTFQTVMNQIEEERINKRAQRYLRDLRNDAYIEYN